MKNIHRNTLYFGVLALGFITSCATKSATKDTSINASNMNNMVARMQVKEPIPGVCDQTNVIVILPMAGNGQVKAVPPKTKAEIMKELNERVVFLKDKPDYEDKGGAHLIINCKGEMVQCEIGNKTKSPELDNQIIAILSELKQWKAGTIHGKSTDTVEFFSFTIKKGQITIS